MTSLSATLTEAARRFPDRDALVAPEGWHLTYGELDAIASDVVAGLAAAGVSEGDVVVLLLPSSPEYVALFLAAARLGAITAGVNVRLDTPTRHALVDLATPTVIIGTPDLIGDLAHEAPTIEVQLATDPSTTALVLENLRPSTVTAAVPRRPTPTAASGSTAWAHDPLGATAASPDRGAAGGNPDVAIVFTSGTTGMPRGAVFTERQIDAIRRIDLGDGWGAGGPMLVSTELVHVGFTTKLCWYLRAGMTMHLLRPWRAADALRVISDHGLTSVGGIPAQISLLLRDSGFDRADTSKVSTIITGGAAVSPALLDEATQRFGAGFSVRYSSTESGGVGCGTDPLDLEEARTSVGRPRPGVEVRILGDDGAPVPSGTEGVVTLRSDAVMDRYWRDPEATAATLVDGWLVTSDLGALDDDGRLRLSGRQSSMYIRGGYNVHPERVEAALSSAPGVADVAIAPRPDPVMGEVGVAVVVPVDPAEPPTLTGLRNHAAGSLAHHELPEDLVLVDRIPHTSLHKLDRTALLHLI